MVHHHGGDLSVNDLLLAVEVKHIDGGHLSRGATGPSGAPWIGLDDQVGMGVLLVMHELTLPGAVVGSITFWSNDPVPAELLKIHSKGVAAAACLRGLLIAVQTSVPPQTLGVVQDLHFDEGLQAFLPRFGRLYSQIFSL